MSKRTKTVEVKQPKKRTKMVIQPPKKRLHMNYAMFAPDSPLRPKKTESKKVFKRKMRNQKGVIDDH